MKKAIGIIIPASFFLFAFIGCQKKIECDNAQLCIRNNSADTVFYCWGCNIYSEIIEPGGVACYDVGYVSYDPYSGSGSTPIVYFESTKGNFAIEVDECDEEKIIE